MTLNKRSCPLFPRIVIVQSLCAGVNKHVCVWGGGLCSTLENVHVKTPPHFHVKVPL